MRVAVAFLTLVVCFLAVFMMDGAAIAGTLEVEPDAFPDLALLNLAFPGVILSNETTRGNPDETDVLVRSGLLLFGPAAGTNVATTGDFVFGRQSAPDPIDNLIVWSGDPLNPTDLSAVLRVDFPIVKAKSVTIDAVADDDDEFEIQAYDNSVPPVLLVSQNMSGTDVVLPLSITRASPDISFIMVAGVPGEGGPMDNLRVEFETLPVFIDIKPQDKRNRVRSTP